MAKRFSLVTRALCFGIFLLGGCSHQTPTQKTIRHLVVNNQTPAYEEWVTQSTNLSKEANNYCQKKTTLENVRQQWRKTRSAWSKVVALPAGELGEQSTIWQIQFWPDNKNLIDFHFRLLKKNPDNNAMTTEQLAKSSTVLRGLGASEYLLFDQSFSPENHQTLDLRCKLLVANTTFQEQFSAKLLHAWQNHASLLLQLPNAEYANDNEALAELLRSEISALDIVKKWISAPIPANKNSPAKKFEAEFWRSDESLNSFKDAIAAHEKLWKNTGWKSLVNEKNPQMANTIDQYYEEIGKTSAQLNKPMNQLLESSEDINTLKKLKLQLGNLEKAYGEGIAKTLGVQIGFNANDGD